MRRWSDRGQVEPFAALAAVLAVAAGLTVYAGTLDETVPDGPDRERAAVTLDRVERAIQTEGVIEPAAVAGAADRGPDGWRVNVTVRSREGQWSDGPVPPNRENTTATVDRASERVSVRLGPARIRPGRVRVVVWR